MYVYMHEYMYVVSDLIYIGWNDFQPCPTYIKKESKMHHIYLKNSTNDESFTISFLKTQELDTFRSM